MPGHMSVAQNPLRGNLGYQVYQLARLYRTFFLSLTHSIHPRIFPEHWIVLNKLSVSASAVPQSDLLSPLAEGMAGLTRTLSALSARGWIKRKRDQEDRRRILVSLTPKGQQAHRRIVEVGVSIRPLLFTGIPPEEAEQVTVIMEKLERNLQQAMAHARRRRP